METSQRLKPVFAAMAVLSLVLVLMGAFVRTTGAGLSCPDWPLCFGKLVPEAQVFSTASGIHQEYAHRALAGILGLIAIAGAVMAWRARKDFPHLWRTASFLLVLLVIQAIFGGLTVMMKLSPAIVTIHLLLGTIFFQASALGAARTGTVPAEHRTLFLAASILVFFQIGLGGLVASTGSGAACRGFPFCQGEADQGALLMLAFHALMALVLAGAALIMFARYGGGAYRGDLSIVWSLMFAQIFVGFCSAHFHLSVMGSLTHLLIAQFLLFKLLSLYRGVPAISKDS